MWKRMKDKQVAARKGNVSHPQAANTELEHSGSKKRHDTMFLVASTLTVWGKKIIHFVWSFVKFIQQ